MSDFHAVSHFFKRGATHVMQALGKEQRLTANDDYETDRRISQNARRIMKETVKNLDSLSKAVDVVADVYGAITTNFEEFARLYDLESTPTVELDFLSRMSRNLKVEAEQFRETIKTNGIKILTVTLASFEPLDALHSELRKVQLDVDVMKKEVAQLQLSINNNAKSKEKDAAVLPERQQQLDKVSERYNRIVATGREQMRTLLSDANASSWSVFGIVYRQTQQNYGENARVFKEVTQQLTMLKNRQESARRLTAERATKMKQEHAESADTLWQNEGKLGYEQGQVQQPKTSPPANRTATSPSSSTQPAKTAPPTGAGGTATTASSDLSAFNPFDGVSMPVEFAAFGQPPTAGGGSPTAEEM